MSLIRLDHITVTYPVFDASKRSLKKTIVSSVVGGMISADRRSPTSITALKGIDVTLQRGDRLGIYGHNGSGKTTLLKVMAGIYPPSTGKVTIDGTIGSFIDIAAGVDNDLSGYEVITLRGLMMGRSHSEINARRDEIITFSGLGEFINLPIRTYSSGMWARLAFSIATAFHSDIVLLDEWLSVGDGEFSTLAQERLKAVVAEAAILVLASHSLDLIKSHCNMIMHLEKGKIASITRTE